jgi:hypothetical protein
VTDNIRLDQHDLFVTPIDLSKCCLRYLPFLSTGGPFKDGPLLQVDLEVYVLGHGKV